MAPTSTEYRALEDYELSPISSPRTSGESRRRAARRSHDSDRETPSTAKRRSIGESYGDEDQENAMLLQDMSSARPALKPQDEGEDLLDDSPAAMVKRVSSPVHDT